MHSKQIFIPKIYGITNKNFITRFNIHSNFIINNIIQIGIANSKEIVKNFAAIKIINSLSHKDEKWELSLINSLEHLHVTIQKSSTNDPKPSTSSQITKPITSNNNRVKNTNSYKM